MAGRVIKREELTVATPLLMKTWMPGKQKPESEWTREDWERYLDNETIRISCMKRALDSIKD